MEDGPGESRTITASTQKTHLTLGTRAITMEIQKQAFLSGLVFASDKDQKIPQWRLTGWSPCLGDRRFTHGTVVVRRQGEEIVVLLGGCAIPSCVPLNSGVCFNVQSKKWQEGPCMHEKRACPASVLCNNAIYVIGGYNCTNGFNSLDTIERIQVEDLMHSSSASIKDTRKWQKLQCRLSTPRYDCAAAVVHDRFIVVAGGRCFFGLEGRNRPSRLTEISSVEILDTAASGNPCTVISGPSLHHTRCEFGMAVVGQRIYVVGGRSLSSVEYLDFDDMLDDSPNCASSVFSSSKSWTIHKNLHLNISEEVHAVVQVGSCLVVAGGWKNRSKRSVKVLDTVNNIVWELPKTIGYSWGCSTVTLSSGIVAMNGCDSRDAFETLSLVDKTSWLFAHLLSIGKVPTI